MEDDSVSYNQVPYTPLKPPSPFITIAHGPTPGKKQHQQQTERQEQEILLVDTLQQIQEDRRAVSLKLRSRLRPLFQLIKMMMLFSLITLALWVCIFIAIVNPNWKNGW